MMKTRCLYITSSFLSACISLFFFYLSSCVCQKRQVVDENNDGNYWSVKLTRPQRSAHPMLRETARKEKQELYLRL